MSLAAEQSYFDGIPVQHIADWQEQQRLARIAKMAERYDAWERNYLSTLMLDVRHVIERADRAIKGGFNA